jgi:hypothetical protein
MTTLSDIPEQFYEKYPELEDVFIEITSSIKALKLSRVEKVYPNETGKPLRPRVPFQFLVYLQVVLNRVIEISESIIISINNSNMASAFILLRALNENSALILDGYIRLEKILKEDNFQKVYEFITNLQYGTKLKNIINEHVNKRADFKNDSYYTEEKIKEIFTSQQILSVIDRLSKYIFDLRERYDHLCEYAHPNYDGLMGLYCNWEDIATVNISKSSNVNKTNIQNIFYSFRLFLKMFVDGYDSILKSLPRITELAISDLKTKGEDTSSYENPI